MFLQKGLVPSSVGLLVWGACLVCAMAIKFWSYYMCVRVGKGEYFLIQIIEGECVK